MVKVRVHVLGPGLGLWLGVFLGVQGDLGYGLS